MSSSLRFEVVGEAFKEESRKVPAPAEDRPNSSANMYLPARRCSNISRPTYIKRCAM